MEITKYIRYIAFSLMALTLLGSCTEEKEKAQQTEFNLRVDESVSIQLPNSTTYTITIDNPAIDYDLSGRQLTVTAIKEGSAKLTAILDSGESFAYSFTVTANAYQIGFNIDSTPPRGIVDRSKPKNRRDSRLTGKLRARHRHHRRGCRQIRSFLRIHLHRDGQAIPLLGPRRLLAKRGIKPWYRRHARERKCASPIRKLYHLHQESKHRRENLVYPAIYRPQRYSCRHRGILIPVVYPPFSKVL